MNHIDVCLNCPKRFRFDIRPLSFYSVCHKQDGISICYCSLFNSKQFYKPKMKVYKSIEFEEIKKYIDMFSKKNVEFILQQSKEQCPYKLQHEIISLNDK